MSHHFINHATTPGQPPGLRHQVEEQAGLGKATAKAQVRSCGVRGLNRGSGFASGPGLGEGISAEAVPWLDVGREDQGQPWEEAPSRQREGRVQRQPG